MEDIDMVVNGEKKQLVANPYLDEPKYFPPELVGSSGSRSNMLFYCYLIDFQYDVKFQDVVLAVTSKLDNDLETLNLDLDANRGFRIKHIGQSTMSSEQVALCQRFQHTVFNVLLDHNLDKIHENLNQCSQRNGSYVFNYLLLPAVRSHERVKLDWKCITSVLYPKNLSLDENSCCFSTRGHGNYMHTKDGLVCLCMLQESLVRTPHNGLLYITSGTSEGFDGNTFLKRRRDMVTYKEYYQQRHGIELQFERQTLLNAKPKRIFSVHNCLLRTRTPSSKEPSNSSCKLPPELCSIIMSSISISTFYSFSFLPSIMHRIESLLIAANLKSMHVDQCTQNVVVPTLTVLEAITTNNCQEKMDLESLETLGDSFLKYAASQQLFKTYQNQREGFLSTERKKRISNLALCKLGCDRKIAGFIRNEQFNPKTWIIPGTNCADIILKEETLSSSKKVYIGQIRKIKKDTVADVIEALVGAYLSSGREIVALSFMAWLGIRVDLGHVPHTMNFAVKPDLYINRLEFLGDAVLDYLITLYFYQKYPGLSPGLLTDLRSVSMNNDCYAQSAVKVKLDKHILCSSNELLQKIDQAARSFEESPPLSTFGWDSEICFPKVLADVIESLAGAIFVDSGYNKEVVFKSMRPLLEPLVTLETLKLHPVRELKELCEREHYTRKGPVVSSQNGVRDCTVEVEANGIFVKEAQPADKNEDIAVRLTSIAVLKSLKESITGGPKGSLA